jgi:4-amino-4-deoxy-L-arabinose transferase-like glycosyltransferase
MVDFRNAFGGPAPKGSRSSKVAALSACIALVANAVATGWLGLDFGDHWDEWVLFDGLANAVKELSVLPRNYIYGGVYFGIGFLLLAPYSLALAPEILTEITADPTRPLALDQYPGVLALQRRLLSLIGDPSFLLTARGAFLVLGSLGTLWVFAALRRLYRGQWLGALAAAAFMATSWEVAYHSRFVTPDAVMVQFAALTFLLIIQALRQREGSQVIGWLLAAAVAAGVTFGCKMPGVFMAVPVLTATIVHHDLGSLRRRLALALAVVVVFGLTYFLTTPGILLDPIRFFANIAWVERAYRSTPGATGLAQCWLVLVWLFGAVPSASVALAISMSAVIVVGIATLWRRHRSFFWCSTAFVLAYASFMSAHQVLMVRNWLIFVPLAAIAFGAGVLTSHEFARARRLSFLVPVCVACAFAYNVAWLWIAAYSIRDRDPAAFAMRLVDYMAGQPKRNFWLSPGLVSIDSDSAKRLACAPNGSGRASVGDQDAVVFLAREHWERPWVINKPWFYELTIGSHEINYDYYPAWVGHNRDRRIVVLTADHARKILVSLDGYRQCRPGA